MLKDNFETAELLMTIFFKVDKLKKRLCTENNKNILDFLECHNHVYHMLSQVIKVDDHEILKQQIRKVIDYTTRLIDYSGRGSQNVENMAEAREMLIAIRQRLQILETAMIKSNIQNSMTEIN
jgi:hypothetical protein